MTTDAGRASAEEELRQLVRSLDDLDAELAAGDLDPDDYEALRNDYTVRVADAVRRSGDPTSTATGSPTAGDTATTDVRPDTGPTSPAAGPRFNRWLVVAALGLFAVGAGWLLARSAGERGIGDALTGSIDQSARQRVTECQNTGMNDGDLLGAIQCFDEVLTTDPENVEALTYRAWFLVLASSSGAAGAEASTDQQTELLEAARVYLDRAIEIEPGYADARAFRSVVADRLGDSDEVCRQIEALIATDPPPFFLQQTAPVAERNGCEPG